MATRFATVISEHTHMFTNTFLSDSLAIQTPAAIVFWGSLGRQVLARELRTVELYKKLALSQRLFLGVSRMR